MCQGVTCVNVAFAVGRCCVRCSGDGTLPHAAAYGDEVSVPALACSHGNSDWWYMYTSTMLIHNGDPCVQRECAAETVCCDRANLCALRRSMYEDRCSRTLLGHNFAPLAFQKPRLGFLTEQTALYTFIWVLARLRPFGRDQDFTYRRMILVFIGSSAATRRLTVTRCRHRPSRFPMVSEE